MTKHEKVKDDPGGKWHCSSPSCSNTATLQWSTPPDANGDVEAVFGCDTHKDKDKGKQ